MRNMTELRRSTDWGIYIVVGVNEVLGVLLTMEKPIEDRSLSVSL
jgi:hypothetical protein